MITAGTVADVGRLDDGELGVVLERPNGERITIKGLTPDEMRAVAPLLFEKVVVTLAPGAETPP